MKRPILRVACLLFCVFIPQLLFASVVEVKTVASLKGERSEKLEAKFDGLLDDLTSAQLRPPANPYVDRQVQYDELFLKAIFGNTLGKVAGVAVKTDAAKRDVLIAGWQPGSNASEIKQFLLLDTPDENLLAIRVDSNIFSSASTLQTFVDRIVVPKYERIDFSKRNSELQITGIKFAMEEAPQALGVIAVGWAQFWPVPAAAGAKGYDFEIAGLRTSSGSYLCFSLGKHVVPKAYPEGTYFVPERFPPLADRVHSWPASRILAETGSTTERDQILIEELLERGLSKQEFNSLLAIGSSTSRPESKVRQIAAVTLYLIQSGDLCSRYEKELESALKYYVQPGKRYREFMLPELESRLSGCKSLDFTDIIIKLVEEGIYQGSGIGYLSWRASTAEIADRLAAAQVPKDLEAFRNNAVNQIRNRAKVQNPTKSIPSTRNTATPKPHVNH